MPTAFSRPILATLLVVLAGGATLSAASQERLVLLPVQDRIGDPELVALVEQTLREELAGRYTLVDQKSVRDGLRAGRIRDAGATTPARMEGMAGELQADLFLSITVHQGVEGPVPVITLSGHSFRPGKTSVDWAGFRSASGLDRRRMLDRGVVGELDDLARRTTRELLDDFRRPGADLSGRVPVPVPKEGIFRRSMINTIGMKRMAVVPFDSVAKHKPQIAAETATAAMLAALHRKGVPLTHPGSVDEILRRRYQQRYGGLDALSRAALLIGGGATRFITGTVDIFEMIGGIEPVPWIALGARVVDVESGQIFWIGGIERTGRDDESYFGLDRVHSQGALLDGMLDTVCSSFLRTVKVERDHSE